jgi:hypothetical protein
MFGSARVLSARSSELVLGSGAWHLYRRLCRVDGYLYGRLPSHGLSRALEPCGLVRSWRVGVNNETRIPRKPYLEGLQTTIANTVKILAKFQLCPSRNVAVQAIIGSSAMRHHKSILDAERMAIGTDLAIPIIANHIFRLGMTAASSAWVLQMTSVKPS